VRERLLFNDDLDFLDDVVAGFWEGAGHGLGNSIGIYCPAAKVVFAPLRGRRARGLQNGSPVDNCVGERPAEGLACGVELTRNRWELAVRQITAPVLRGRQDFGIFPLGFTP